MSPYYCLCLFILVRLASGAPANGFVFPDEGRREKKLEPIITPPVLPYLEHLERDPSTLLPSDNIPKVKNIPENRRLKPKHGFGGGFSVSPSSDGGLTASISSSASGAGASHSTSQSFAFGFNNGFSASQSASQASSFNGFGSGFGGSQASSQAASFNGGGASGAASSAAAFGHGGGSGSQSASSAFGFNGFNNGFNSLNPPNDEVDFSDGLLDIRHRGAPNFPFAGRGRGVGAAAVKTTIGRPSRGRNNDWLAVFVSD